MAQGEYLTDRLTDEAIQMLKKFKEDPFFLYFPFTAFIRPCRAARSQEKYASRGNQLSIMQRWWSVWTKTSAVC